MIETITLSEDSRAARVQLANATLQISQNQSGAWRLLQVVDDTCDPMGAAQILAAELDGKPREETTMLEFSGKDLVGQGPTSLRLGESICLLDAAGRELTRITDVKQSASVTGTLTDDERLYGTGERFNRLDQRGKTVSIWAVDKWNETEGNSYVPIPLMRHMILAFPDDERGYDLEDQYMLGDSFTEKEEAKMPIEVTFKTLHFSVPNFGSSRFSVKF